MLKIVKDYVRTGSSISLINGKLEVNLAEGSGFEVKEEKGTIYVKASGRLYGNVAGTLGTIVSIKI